MHLKEFEGTLLLVIVVMLKSVISASISIGARRTGAAVLKSYSEPFDGDVFSPLRSTGLTCRLCVIVDHEFLKAYGQGSQEQLLIKLEALVDAVGWNWRAVDWNGDKFPDNIGFKITRVGWNPYIGADYNISRPAMTLLSELGLIDFSDCCLGIGFTMRPFVEKEVGIAFTASKTRLGGICDYRAPQHRRLTSTNIILITGHGLSGYPLSSTDLELVLMHELGHAFGIRDHDNAVIGVTSEDFRQCSGHPEAYMRDPNFSDEYFLASEPPAGRFVMWSDNKQGRRSLKWNNLQFSPCSKRQVAEILKTKRGVCFVEDQGPFCGNNIIEQGEECDCGTEVNCALLACCGSRKSDTPCKRLNSAVKNAPQTCPNKHAYPFSVALGERSTKKPASAGGTRAILHVALSLQPFCALLFKLQ